MNLAAPPTDTGHFFYITGESGYGNDFGLQFKIDNRLKICTAAGAHSTYTPAPKTLANQLNLIVAAVRPSPEKFSAMKMVSTSTENKQFTARHVADPIFMLGGARTAHVVLSEYGYLPYDGTPGHIPRRPAYQGGVKTMLVSLDPALVANSLFPMLEKCRMCET